MKSKVLTEDRATADLEQDLLYYLLQSVSSWMQPAHMQKSICFHLTLLQITELPPQLTCSWQQLQEEKKSSFIAYRSFFINLALGVQGSYAHQVYSSMHFRTGTLQS